VQRSQTLSNLDERILSVGKLEVRVRQRLYISELLTLPGSLVLIEEVATSIHLPSVYLVAVKLSCRHDMEMQKQKNVSMKRPTKRDADTESLEQAVAVPSTVHERDPSQESSPTRSSGSITPPSGEVSSKSEKKQDRLR